MTKEHNFDIGKMHIELFLPSEKLRENIIIPRLAQDSRIISIQSGDEDVDGCDALITGDSHFSLGIKTADCAPICLSDGEKIGIMHIGWRGLCLGLIEKMLVNFNGKTLDVYVAPFLHSFEIKKDSCYDRVTEKFGKQFFEEKSGKIFFNFKNAIHLLLPSQTVYDARDTETDKSFPSHRRDGTKSRFVTAVSFR